MFARTYDCGVLATCISCSGRVRCVAGGKQSLHYNGAQYPAFCSNACAAKVREYVTNDTHAVMVIMMYLLMYVWMYHVCSMYVDVWVFIHSGVSVVVGAVMAGEHRVSRFMSPGREQL